ncbi:hypothetical protein [Ruegeria marina]|uniref:YmgD protein n=1 Tax=Ruegeria marina TaxID=639004 RepID=A0A1G7F714_9RHOB|nr:hypothetical protein [Ruegeria marina]SDE71682.1 hypothetical protein SAMN04488239_13018 [Ruegeria marina]
MHNIIKIAAVAAVALTASSASAQMDAEMSRILDAAMPYMHHSCESVLANYGEDENQVAEIVRLMVAVSLFNREYNIEAMFPDETERATLKDKFTAALEEKCEADPNTLLAGAVDAAVEDAVH